MKMKVLGFNPVFSIVFFSRPSVPFRFLKIGRNFVFGFGLFFHAKLGKTNNRRNWSMIYHIKILVIVIRQTIKICLQGVPVSRKTCLSFLSLSPFSSE